MPKLDPYAERLLRFRESEKPEFVLMVADSPHLVKIVVAWTSMPVCRKRQLRPLKGITEEAIWNWLWENTEYSQDELLKRIPAADTTTTRKIDALIANRVLYPDGKANSFVEKFMREQVLRHFDRKHARQ
ncbi:MAG TPA: hypothetical protein VHP11_08890 [Tepidisphaeraceae bacterium]|nr:hypothetical protein [Tepidisphaeraceae bacterium]